VHAGLRPRGGVVSALVNAIRVLRCFSKQEPELRLTEISRRLGLSKSNTHRIVSILAEEGLLYRDPGSGRYRLGLGLFELGARALRSVDLGPLPLPVMSELWRRTGETVLLGVLEADEVVYIQRIESPRLLRISHAGNPRAPIHCTGTGKAILAWRSEAEIARVIRRGLPAYTERTITDPERFRRHLAEVRRLGYAVSDQEREVGTRSVAAPVRDATGAVVAALTVAAPAQRLPRAQIPALAALVMDAARRLSEQLRLRAQRQEDEPPLLIPPGARERA